MLFRILPVMVWSFTGSLVGTSLAALEGHAINWLPFALVLVISALVQGYPTHILNEIFDWKSGADSHELRAQKSGGSKVLQAKLLNIKDLWIVFAISNVLIAVLALICVSAINSKILFYFILPGYLSGLLYSLPPFRFSYRPFLGEWLGGFAGIFFLVLGSFYVQAGSVNSFAVLTAVSLGLIFVGIMIFFHYLDFTTDKLAEPPKNTTVVYLGLAGSRRYAYVCLLSAVALFCFSILKFQALLTPLLLLAIVVMVGHRRSDLHDELSIVKWGKVITYSTIMAGLILAAMAKPALALMTIPVMASFWAHKKFGKIKRPDFG